MENWQSLYEAPSWTGQGSLRNALRKGSSKAILGFSGGSDGKASLCSAGDQGSIPGLERSPGEVNGSPPQYSCLENPMDGGAWCRLQFMGSLESDTTERLHFHFSLSCTGEGNGNHSSVLAWRIPGGAWWASIYGVAQSRTRLK